MRSLRPHSAVFTFFLAQNTATLVALRARFTVEALDEVAEYLTELVHADFADTRRRYLAEYELIVFAARDPALAEALAAWDRARAAELALVLDRLGVLGANAAARTLVEVVRGFQLANLGCSRPDLGDLGRRLHDVVRALAPPRKKGTAGARRRKAR